jgi:hypothetical protein
MAERLFVCASLLKHAIQLTQRPQNVKLCSQYNMERANQLAARDRRDRGVNNRDTSSKVHETWAQGLETRWLPPIPSLIRGHSPTGTRGTCNPMRRSCTTPSSAGRGNSARPRTSDPLHQAKGREPCRQAVRSRSSTRRLESRARESPGLWPKANRGTVSRGPTAIGQCGTKSTAALPGESAFRQKMAGAVLGPGAVPLVMGPSAGLRLKSGRDIGVIHLCENKPHKDAGCVGGRPTVLAGRNCSI